MKFGSHLAQNNKSFLFMEKRTGPRQLGVKKTDHNLSLKAIHVPYICSSIDKIILPMY